MVSFEAAILVCLTAVCILIFVIGTNQSKHNIDVSDRNRLQKITDGKSSHFVEREKLDSKCDICFGDIGNEVIRVCGCGRTFHIECSDATGECPYCKMKKETMSERIAVKTVCPTCGRRIGKNICECGTIVPDADGSYVCRCGETASVGTKGCRKCGSGLKAEARNK